MRQSFTKCMCPCSLHIQKCSVHVRLHEHVGSCRRLLQMHSQLFVHSQLILHWYALMQVDCVCFDSIELHKQAQQLYIVCARRFTCLITHVWQGHDRERWRQGNELARRTASTTCRGQAGCAWGCSLPLSSALCLYCLCRSRNEMIAWLLRFTYGRH